ncbi:Copper amine oxidase 1 [Colletotrichum tanaceti]|nr:Copper amine oxidase 1 [Colletotrichum tanaceti]
MSVPHPPCPLSGAEIQAAAQLIQTSWPTSVSLRFKVVTLSEPAKAELAPYLDAKDRGLSPTQPDRRAFLAYYVRGTDLFHEAIVNLTSGEVESNIKLGANVHGNVDYDEAQMVEKIALEDPKVLAEIKKLELPEGAVVCADPWIYGTCFNSRGGSGSDGVNDDERLYQVFLYMRDPDNSAEPDSNHYAFPLPILPVVECNEYKIIRIDILPTGADNTIKPLSSYKPKPANEYIPESQNLRQDLKPLHVTQPQGPSFTVTPVGETGNVLEWQKWSFFVGMFGPSWPWYRENGRLTLGRREGMVLYNVKYDGRPLFYRLSLSEMSVPYGDPRHPFHKKAAFDLGDAGAGATANNLQLGCDCLGSIQYLSGVIADDRGQPDPRENCICIHEQDAGISWKHTNYRTGRAAVVRSRELVLQSIITVSNYEYILMFIFNQAGEVTYEVRATGILSTQPIDHELDKVGTPFGTVVHPGVLAGHHQHIFSLRVDPMIDGHTNQLVYSEAHKMPRDPDRNPHGTGYEVVDTVVDKTSGLDLDFDVNRTFKITNPNSLNPVNGKPVAYKIAAPPFQKLMSDRDSFNYKRAEFADHNIYVTTHRDRELYAGGWYTNQSRGGTGVRGWSRRNETLTPESDIVVWVQFGINHVPRIEDFPVMPVEILKVHLKPVNFFDKNPALDVPPSQQSFNRSTLVQSSKDEADGCGCEAPSSKL